MAGEQKECETMMMRMTKGILVCRLHQNCLLQNDKNRKHDDDDNNIVIIIVVVSAALCLFRFFQSQKPYTQDTDFSFF